MQYWLSVGDGKSYGPYEIAQLQQFAAEGRLNAGSQLCAVGSTDWMPASSVVELAGLAQPPTSPTGVAPSAQPLPPAPPAPIPPLTPRPATTPTTHDSVTRMLIPVEVEPVSLVAGYLGLFSIVLFPAPLALGCGLWALARLKGRTDVCGAGRAWTAVVLGSLGTLGLIAFVTTRM